MHTESAAEEIRGDGAAGARRPLRRHRPRAGRRGRRARGRRSSARSTSSSTTPARSTTSAQFQRPVARALGARPARQPHRRLQLRAGGLAAHEGARLGADREHGLRRGHARRLRPGELLDDEGRPARPDQARSRWRAAATGSPATRSCPGIIGTEAFHMANAAMNERIVEPDGLQAARRAAGDRERDRLSLLRPRRRTSPASS